MRHRTYLAVDLKSFYASVECIERGLDPLTTNLVVADLSRTEKTICLAVTPSLKAYGIPGRARLFEVVQKVKEVNAYRLQRARAILSPAPPATTRRCKRTRNWPWTILLPHPGWHFTWSGAPGSIRST